MEPWQSWAAIVLGGGAIYCYYYGVPGLKETPRSAQTHLGSEVTQVRKGQRREDSKTTKRRGDGLATPVQNKGSDTVASGSEEPIAKRKVNKKAIPSAPSTPDIVHPVDDSKEEETDNKNWAADLLKLKEGSDLAPPKASNQRQKTVRQSAADANRDFPNASSATPADADDEMSPVVSPALQAKSSGADVSDMLEASSPGPSTLRLTTPTQPKPTKQQRKQGSPQAQETQKQRQNRQKAEVRKLEREEQEKARRILEEKQRRTAREARGEPAKNGVVSAPAPASNAWKQGAPSGSVQAPVPSDLANGMTQENQLLDTFDQDTTASTASSSGRAASPNSNTTAGTNWDGPLPSEEEQLRIINENDDATWSTVPSGKKNRKKAAPTPDDDATNQAGNDASFPVPAVAKPNKENRKEAKPASTGGSRAGFSVLDNVDDWANYSQHPGDSDWSVV
ncbi:MAG: hypothetical protein Q9165_004499 [Trypethelium subeluteriae]